MKKTATLLITLGIILISSVLVFGQKRLVADTKWKLTEAAGLRISQTLAAISFDRSGTSFSGSTGCNSMSGNVDIRGENINFGAVRTTRIMCKLMPGSVPESVVLEGLKAARRFDVRGNYLTLYDRRGRMLLKFTRAKDDNADDVRLDNRKWVLEQIKGRQTFVALPYAFLNFDAKKHSAGGNSGCNVFGGSYTASGKTIMFKDMISTMRACIEDNKMAVERDMLDGLRAAKRFEIRGDRLYLYRGSELLLTFRGEDK
jgi:heat shock protein HslJ